MPILEQVSDLEAFAQFPYRSHALWGEFQLIYQATSHAFHATTAHAISSTDLRTSRTTDSAHTTDTADAPRATCAAWSTAAEVSQLPTDA